MTAPVLSPFDGALLIDKPQKLTSHDVVDHVRRNFHFNKVGHAGSLDPMATGLLILLIERGTKISEKLMGQDKVYEGEMTLGTTTTSQDADGEVLETKDVPGFSRDQIEEVFLSFIGDQYQIPPMVSAIKHQGKPLHKLAREGKTVEREPRFIHIYEFRLQEFNSPRISFRVTCTKGTYVRTLAHDVGQKLGCGAHLSALRRIQSGKFQLQKAHTLDEVLARDRQSLLEWILPLVDVSRT